jgi:hypothetical protein
MLRQKVLTRPAFEFNETAISAPDAERWRHLQTAEIEGNS